MKTCICTIIKNEHQYLEEWIKYNLDLGIDHIFIFEDIDSETHKDITDKYDKVSLACVDTILNEKEQKYVRVLKTQHRVSAQDLYFIKGLSYIQSKNVYDWCFVIDIDEFITCDSLNVLEKYASYDAVIMSWKTYGSCGHITRPNDGNVFENYPYKTNGFLTNKRIFHCKSCYNVKTFKPSFLGTVHQPTDKCNWCRTDFSKDREELIFDNIYIRHYLSKSWQDYVEKRTKRGYFIGITRTNDFYFNLNPEFKCIRKELMQAFEDETLVVLPYKQSGSQGTELELALSLWKKYCTFNYHFVVIGEFDKSLEEKFPWVEFIECATKAKVDGQYNPHLDILNKFVTVIDKYKDKYNGFLWMTDDNYAIKPFTLFDILQTHYHASSFTGNSKSPVNYWNHNKWKTRQLLDKENLPHINYTTHYPCWFDMEKLLFIVDKYDLLNESYVLEDVYFNYYEHDKPVLDSEIRLGIWDSKIFERDFNEAITNPDIKFVCNSVEGWSKELEDNLYRLTL